MICGIGIDIVNVKRIKNLIDRWGNSFIERIYTDDEIFYCESRSKTSQHYAARFSAKEAFFKMLSTETEKFSFKDVEVINNSTGKPEFDFSPVVEKILKDKNIVRVHLSLTHEKKYAAAQVIGEGVVE